MAMNLRLLIPIGTAVAGFALAWLVKPSPESGASPSLLQSDRGKRAGSGPDTGDSGRDHGSRPVLNRPALPGLDPGAPDQALLARVDRAFKDAASQRERAKLIRLTEAVGLTDEQLDQFEALLAERRHQPPIPGFNSGVSPKETLDRATEAAKAFDAKFRALLTPDQALALSGYRERQEDNRAEARAQRELSDVIDRIDVTPQQRQSVLEVLKASAAAEQAKLPEGAGLLLESSPTMMGGGAFSQQSIDAMTLLGNDPEVAKDPLALSRKMQERQHEQMMARAESLATILTPAQMIQYRAAIDSQSAGAAALNQGR